MLIQVKADNSTLYELLNALGINDVINVNSVDFKILNEGAFSIYIYMVLANNKNNITEALFLSKKLLSSNKYKDDLMFNAAKNIIADNSLYNILENNNESQVNFSNKLIQLNDTINTNLSSDSAFSYKKSLVTFAYKIIDSTGDIFSYSSNMCTQEIIAFELMSDVFNDKYIF